MCTQKINESREKRPDIFGKRNEQKRNGGYYLAGRFFSETRKWPDPKKKTRRPLCRTYKQLFVGTTWLIIKWIKRRNCFKLVISRKKLSYRYRIIFSFVFNLLWTGISMLNYFKGQYSLLLQYVILEKLVTYSTNFYEDC